MTTPSKTVKRATPKPSAPKPLSRPSMGQRLANLAFLKPVKKK